MKPTVRTTTRIAAFYILVLGHGIFSNMVFVLLLLPQALRFYGSYNVTVTGITIQNSPQCHLKFDNCDGVLVHDMSVSSPGDSPNTDGIHLQNSKDVLIHSSTLACGNTLLYNLLLHLLCCSRSLPKMKLENFSSLP